MEVSVSYYEAYIEVYTIPLEVSLKCFLLDRFPSCVEMSVQQLMVLLAKLEVMLVALAALLALVAQLA